MVTRLHQASISAGRALSMKMFVALELRGLICSNFVYFGILTMSNRWYAKWWRGFIEYHFGRSSSFNENVHKSWTAWYILYKFCVLLFNYIFQPLVCKMVTRLHQASFDRSSSFCKMLITLGLHGIFLFKFRILMYFEHSYPLICKMMTMLHWASSWPVELS